ncbi:MAG TPA: hypothetical protein VIY26_03295 [Acidimicrobiales bacterium]
MTTVLGLAAGFIAVVAAARSTWSPCGLSMLSSITPLAEQGRGHRYRTTAAWFVVGSVLGGASLGLLMAALAAGVGAIGASSTLIATVAAVACLVTIAADTRVAGFHLPIHRRQVNERWLDQFRPWVYGAGFGWQIGAGVATYIKTCAVYLMIALGVLTGSPTTALLVGVAFGLVRGLAVFLGRHITSAAALAEFHRRLVAAEPVARAAMTGCEVAAALTFCATVSPWLAVGAVAVTVAVGLAGLMRSPSRSVRRPMASLRVRQPAP